RRQSRRLRSSNPLSAPAKPPPPLSRGSVEPTPLMSFVKPTLMSLFGLRLPPEDEVGRAEGDSVALAQLRPLLAASVHLHPVRGVEVDRPVGRSLLAHLGVLARYVRVRQLDVAVLRPPDRGLDPVELVFRTVHLEADELAAEPELLDGDGLGLDRLAVDHRRAVLRLGRRLAGLRRRTLHHPRRDPELAHLEVVVGLELDYRGREQLVALAARVLGDVVLQLSAQRLLVALELLPVGRTEVDDVLVRRI